MVIRRMTEEDYKDVFDLWSETEGIGLSDVNDTFEGIRAYLGRNPTTCFVAEEGGALAGVILSGHDGRRGFIYHAAVRAALRGRGIGTALVGAALDALKKEGITKTALVAFSKNDKGNKFWETLGFTKRDDLVYRNKSLI
jgi:ribosomal protein S18 acetylase RimI-like enzyme